MVQVEIIEKQLCEIQSSINRWLVNNNNYTIINISLTTHIIGKSVYYTALITYKE